MLKIITGTPGNGKTLYTIESVEKLREERKKKSLPSDVYYWNIGKLTLDWRPIGDADTFGKLDEGVEPDASKVVHWFELPAGAIIVIDEAQKVFPVRPRGAPVPKHVSELETHRHRGIDIILLTQNPKLIDSHVRKLCGMHHHLRRVFGMERSHLFTWTEECADVDTRNNFSRAQDSYWTFAKKYYGTYKSAEVHTHAATLPKKWIATIAICVLSFPLLVWMAWSRLYPDESVTQEQLGQALDQQHRKTVDEVVVKVKELMERDPWDARLHQPRVSSIDASAPFYDALVRPVSMPKVAGCGKLVFHEPTGERIDCWCSSQQGTRLTMSTRECLRYMEKGWFDFTKPDVDPREDEPEVSDAVGPTEKTNL